MKPATALPWATLEKPAQDKDNRCRVLAKDGGVAILCVNRTLGDPGPSSAEIQNAKYIAHTANSYPMLVEALRKMVEEAAHSQRSGEAWSRPAILASGKALLRELGEVK